MTGTVHVTRIITGPDYNRIAAWRTRDPRERARAFYP